MASTGRRPTNEQIVSHVTARLQGKLPAVSPAEIRKVVTDLVHSYAESRVRDFIPVLVEREAFDALDQPGHRRSRADRTETVGQDA